MIRSLLALFCCALLAGSALGGNITIPTDNCVWREETYGAWNQCFGGEIVIGEFWVGYTPICMSPYTPGFGYMVFGYMVFSAIWSIFGWSRTKLTFIQ